MKKKAYQKPEIDVTGYEQKHVICASTQTTVGISENAGYDEQTW